MENKSVLTRLAEVIGGNVPEEDLMLAKHASQQPAGTVWRTGPDGVPVQQKNGEVLKDLVKTILGLNGPNPVEMQRTLATQVASKYENEAAFNVARNTPYGDVNGEAVGQKRDLKSIVSALLEIASGPVAGAAPTKMSQLKKLDKKIGK